MFMEEKEAKTLLIKHKGELRAAAKEWLTSFKAWQFNLRIRLVKALWRLQQVIQNFELIDGDNPPILLELA